MEEEYEDFNNFIDISEKSEEDFDFEEEGIDNDFKNNDSDNNNIDGENIDNMDEEKIEEIDYKNEETERRKKKIRLKELNNTDFFLTTKNINFYNLLLNKKDLKKIEENEYNILNYKILLLYGINILTLENKEEINLKKNKYIKKIENEINKIDEEIEVMKEYIEELKLIKKNNLLLKENEILTKTFNKLLKKIKQGF